MTAEELRSEIAHNVDRLRAELAQIEGSHATPPDSEWAFHAYESMDLTTLDEEGIELVNAFYRALAIVIDGHPGLLDADPERIDQSHRIVLEATIDLGDRLVKRLAG